MNKTELLKNIFDNAHNGVYVDLNTLPEGISREVVEKNLLWIELQHCTDEARKEEIKAILYPVDEEEGEE